MRLKRGAKGLTELRCILHAKGPAEVTARPLPKKPGQWEMVGSNIQEKFDHKAIDLVAVLMARVSQQMRTWPESPEEVEVTTNYHAKDAKMTPVPCGCKATAITTAHCGRMGQAGEEEAWDT